MNNRGPLLIRDILRIKETRTHFALYFVNVDWVTPRVTVKPVFGNFIDAVSVSDPVWNTFRTTTTVDIEGGSKAFFNSRIIIAFRSVDYLMRLEGSFIFSDVAAAKRFSRILSRAMNAKNEELKSGLRIPRLNVVKKAYKQFLMRYSE